MTVSSSQPMFRTRFLRNSILNERGSDRIGEDHPPNERSPWTLRLRPTQVGILSLGVVVLLIVSFFIGLRAGESRALEELRERAVDQLVRLPVARVPAAEGSAPSQPRESSAAQNALGRRPDEARLSSPDLQGGAVLSHSGLGSVTASKTALSKQTQAAGIEKRANGGSQSVGISVTEDRSGIGESPRLTAGFAAKQATVLLDRADSASGSVVAAAQNESPPAADRTESASTGGSVNRSPTRPFASPVASHGAAVKPEPQGQVLKATETKPGNLTQKLKVGWYVQLAASSSANEAVAIAEKLRNRGLSPLIQRASVNNTSYSRVLVGPYQSRVRALDDQQRIKAWGVAKGEPFVRYVSG